MCGIFGIITKKEKAFNAAMIKSDWATLNALSSSRGKDSSGGVFYNESGKKITVVKGDVSVNSLMKDQHWKDALGSALKSKRFLAMGHTRLVTNGSQLDNDNNQPVIKDGGLLLHNGIIVNHKELWSQNNLHREFEIDSEIILALIQSRLNLGVEEAVNSCNQKLQGTYSYACILPSLDVVVLSSNNGSLYCYEDDGVIVFASERSFLIELQLVSDHAMIQHIAGGESRVFALDDFEMNPFEIAVHEVIGKGNGLKVLDSSAFMDSKYAGERKLLEFNWEEINALKRCSKCVLPETFPFIAFDQDGVCNYCHSSKPIQVKGNLDDLMTNIQPFLSHKEDNCIVPLSGGRDSIFSLHLVKEVMGLKPVTMTYDWGMVTDLARRNIARACGEMGVENIIFAADSDFKRKNIRLNLEAWLKQPHLGMVPLFMAGDKYFFHYCSELQNKLGIELNIWGAHQYENTDFKVGFAGVSPNFEKEKIYSLSLQQKMKLMGFVGKQFVSNPSYFNSSLMDTLGAYKARDQFNFNGHFQIFDYFDWDEKVILDTIENKYGWERAIDSDSTWRIGDGTTSFYNYIYFVVAGFSEVETFRSNQIRNGKLTREEAMKRIEQENHPRFESIKWYLHMIGLDFETVIKRINRIPKLYRK
jgi:predicted glutamine amidotransferase